MLIINQFRTYFWTIDPGYFNLKQAAKTILAILISLCLVRDEVMLTQVIAGVASGASMQGIVAKSLMSRMVQLFVFDLMYVASFILGLMVRDAPYWTAVLLVGLGFAVNYIRRFSLDNSMAPMMAWTFCFLATILPFTSINQLWPLVEGMLVGILVSAVIIIFVFPENHPRLFVNNSNRFFQALAQGLREIRQFLLVADERGNFSALSFVSIKASLEQLLASNQAIQQSKVFAHDQQQVNCILMHQYALLTAYSLMIDVYYSLWISKHQLSRAAVLALSHKCKEYAYLFSTTSVSANYRVHADSTPAFLPNLAERLGKISLKEPALIMALLNFKLSFNLLKQHETDLLRGVDEA